MSRHIDPPREQWDGLPTPLTSGEREVAELFDAKLPNQWEMYIQPHLNGLRPDFVLLHPQVGVGVFEVKDWDLSGYSVHVGKDGVPRLIARDKSGNTWQPDNPVEKIRRYKDELFDLYCPRLNERSGRAVITAGVIFTRSTRAQAHGLLAPFRDRDPGMAKYPRYYPLSGSDDLQSANIDSLFPEAQRKPSSIMSEEIANDLRGWLREPAFSREQREPLQLGRRQRWLTTTRTASGYRRLKGPAGSGKSLVLAARAAELAGEGKEVLVCSYNITLLNYLRDLAARHGARRQVVRRRITFLNFHYWCKRVCLAAGHEKDYDDLWRDPLDCRESSRDVVLDSRLAELVQRVLNRQRREQGPVSFQYDGILVDEGQDFQPHWWQTLRKALKDGGEMLLVADKTQNVYGTAGAWTEEAMVGAGFRGEWSELDSSYRLPPSIVPIVREFADKYLVDEEIDAPPFEQSELDLYPTTLRWVQVSRSRASDACVEEVHWQMKNLRVDVAVTDITFLSGPALGRKLVKECCRRNVRVLHTFDQRGKDARRQKLAFFQGDARSEGNDPPQLQGLGGEALSCICR